MKVERSSSQVPNWSKEFWQPMAELVTPQFGISIWAFLIGISAAATVGEGGEHSKHVALVLAEGFAPLTVAYLTSAGCYVLCMLLVISAGSQVSLKRLVNRLGRPLCDLAVSVTFTFVAFQTGVFIVNISSGKLIAQPGVASAVVESLGNLFILFTVWFYISLVTVAANEDGVTEFDSLGKRMFGVALAIVLFAGTYSNFLSQIFKLGKRLAV
jgi:hypothetical protein